GRNVARAEPAVVGHDLAAFALEVARYHPIAAHLELADGLAVVWQALPILAGETEFDAEDLTPLLDLHVDDLLWRRVVVPGERCANGDDRARFGHAPGMQQEDAEQIAEFLDRGAGRRRAAREDELQFQPGQIEPGAVVLDIGEEIEPDCRYAAGLR